MAKNNVFSLSSVRSDADKRAEAKAARPVQNVVLHSADDTALLLALAVNVKIEPGKLDYRTSKRIDLAESCHIMTFDFVEGSRSIKHSFVLWVMPEVKGDQRPAYYVGKAKFDVTTETWSGSADKPTKEYSKSQQYAIALAVRYCREVRKGAASGSTFVFGSDKVQYTLD